MPAVVTYSKTKGFLAIKPSKTAGVMYNDHDTDYVSSTITNNDSDDSYDPTNVTYNAMPPTIQYEDGAGDPFPVHSYHPGLHPRQSYCWNQNLDPKKTVFKLTNREIYPNEYLVLIHMLMKQGLKVFANDG